MSLPFKFEYNKNVVFLFWNKTIYKINDNKCPQIFHQLESLVL
jgi:hypothetical protein